MVIDGPDHSFVVGGEEPNERHHQQAGIEFDGSIELGERPDLGVPPLLANLGMDRIPDDAPLVGRSLQTVDFDTANGAVESDPGHDLGVGERPTRTTDLPDSVVRIGPVVDEESHDRHLDPPDDLVHGDAVGASPVDGVHELPVDVELELPGGGIADPHRRRSLVSGEPVDLQFGQATLTGWSVHDLQLIGITGGDASQPSPASSLLLHASPIRSGPRA